MSGSVLNPNIALQAGQGTTQPTNMLASYGQAQQLQGNALAIQSQQRALASQAALGKAYQDNTDSTGNVNLAGVRAELAQSQGGSLALSSDNAGNTISQGQGMASVQGTNLANSASRLGIFAHTLQGLITDPNVSSDKVKSAGQSLVDGGVFSQGQMDQELQNVPSDPTQLKSWLSTHQATAGQALAQIGVQYPTGAVSNGAGTILGAQAPGYAPNAGAITPSQYVQNQLSPGEATAPTQIGTNQTTGQPIMGTRSQYVNETQGGASGGPAAGPFGSGRYPTPGQQPGGGVAMGLPAGQEEGMKTAGAASGQAYSDAQTRASSFSTRMYQGQTALSALQQLGPTGTGPGTAGRNEIVSYAASLGFTAPSDQTKAYDEANKYLTAAASSTPGASGSNERLATALSSNASTHISNLAAQDVVKANIALDRQNQAALQSFNALPPAQRTPDQWQTYATNWSSKVDPRVYAFDLMSPQQRTSMMKNWQTPQKAQFYGQVQQAQGLGLVQAPNSGAASTSSPQPAAGPQVPTQ